MELSSHLVCFVFASVSLCSVASCSICTEPLYNSSLDHKAIDKCIGDPDADEENPVLKAEQDAQVSTSM